MAVSFVNVGTVAETTTTGNLSPGLPSGIASNDLLICFAYGADASTFSIDANPTTWTELYNTSDASAGRIGVWYCKYPGSGSAPTITVGGTRNVQSAVIAGFSGQDQTSPIDTSSSRADAGADTTYEFTNLSVTSSGCMIVQFAGLHDNHAISGWNDSASNSYTEQLDDANAGGDDCEIALATATWSSSGTLSSMEVSSPQADPGWFVAIALKPGPVPILVTPTADLATGTDTVTAKRSSELAQPTETSVAITDTVAATVTGADSYTDLVMFWRCEDTTLGTGDTYQTDNTATLTNAEISATAVKIGTYGLYCDALEHWAEFSNNGEYVTSSEEGRFGAWVKIPTWYQWCGIFRCDTDDTNKVELTLYSSGELNFSWKGNSSTSYIYTSGAGMSTGTWYFVQVAWKRSTNYMEVFVNTEAQTGESVSKGSTITDGPMTAWTATPTALRIGAFNSNDSSLYLDNVMFSTDSSRNLNAIRSETSTPKGGVTNLSVNPTADSVSITDTPAIVFNGWNAQPTVDSVNITDTASTRISISAQPTADNVNITDDQQVRITVSAHPTEDQSTITDTATATLGLVSPRLVTVTDTVNITDTTTEIISYPEVHTSDESNITDTVTAGVGTVASLSASTSDNVNVSDNVAGVMSIEARTSDSSTITDTVLSELSTIVGLSVQPTGDSVAITDTASSRISISVSPTTDTVNITDTPQVSVSSPSATISDAITITDSISAALEATTPLSVNVSDSVSISDSVTAAVAAYIFSQNFNTESDWDYSDWLPCYNFDGCLFGYTENKIQNSNNTNVTGGVSGRCHQIPIFGMTGDQTNFDIHFYKDFDPHLEEYYVRFYLKISSNFNTDPGANWKVTYNYYEHELGGNEWVFWMRPTVDAEGFQPAIYTDVTPDHETFGNQTGVPTFYFADHKNEWICFEYYMNYSTSTCKVWITDPNAGAGHSDTYNETLYIVDTSFVSPSGTGTNLIKFGAYWDGAEQEDNYIWIDEIVVSNSYIGPLAPSAARSVRVSDSVTITDLTAGKIEIDKLSVSDAISITDSVSANITTASLSANISDNVAITDTVPGKIELDQLRATDNLTIEDVIIAAVEITLINIGVSDSVSITDQIISNILIALSASDSVAISDATQALLNRLVYSSDSVAITDSIASKINIALQTSDAVTVSDIAAIVLNSIKPLISDSITITDRVDLWISGVTTLPPRKTGLLLGVYRNG